MLPARAARGVGPSLSFLVLALLELAVPLWAERTGIDAAGIPHHIAERYGLFTIILLGESVFAATNAVQAALADGRPDRDLVVVAVVGLLILFGAVVALLRRARRRRAWPGTARSFIWGYGHYACSPPSPPLGAGLEVAVVGDRAPQRGLGSGDRRRGRRAGGHRARFDLGAAPATRREWRSTRVDPAAGCGAQPGDATGGRVAGLTGVVVAAALVVLAVVVLWVIVSSRRTPQGVRSTRTSPF